MRGFAIHPGINILLRELGFDGDSINQLCFVHMECTACLGVFVANPAYSVV